MESKTTARLAIAALCVSVISALFTGGQWYEAHLARQSQEAATKEQMEEQRRSRLLAQTQTMEAERANILAQRKLNPKLAKDESDMPRLTAVYQTQFVPLIRLGSDYDPVKAFLTKEKSVVITNVGSSTAYGVVAKNYLQISDKGEGGIYLQRGLEEDHQNVLAPGASMTVLAEEHSHAKPEELDAFHKGEASYFVSGGVQYRDAFNRMRVGNWCYEFTVKKSLRHRDLEEKLCPDLKVRGLPIVDRIEHEKKDKDDTNEK